MFLRLAALTIIIWYFKAIHLMLVNPFCPTEANLKCSLQAKNSYNPFSWENASLKPL